MKLKAMIGSLLRHACYFVMPALVFGAIWFSLLSHYYIQNPTITDEMLEQGRHTPDDALLEELSGFYFFGAESRGRTVEAAEQILRGEFALPGDISRTIHLPFDSRDIDKGPPGWQLFQARLVAPRMLLAAYRITGREEFFIMARDVILGWALFERRAFLPKGLLWNDHAIAERVLALAEFWTLYRHHQTYDAKTARSIFITVARAGQLLADPTHFTVSTNHGVMQNLALWHLSLAFPSLPEAARYSQLAFERLSEQLPFYINTEGFVLEHSADYHKAGVQFVSMAFRYMSLQGIQVPSEWRKKYEKAQEIYAELRRPDGSLPMFGDTGRSAFREGPLVTVSSNDGRYGLLSQKSDWSPGRARSLYPVAGYSVWWDGLKSWPVLKDLTQTVIAWSYFPGQAHKHADDMSVLLWAKGQSWWTNVGYWPYGELGRAEAESWNGSNAPHMVGESAFSDRKTKMLGQGWVDGLNVVDLERRGPRGYVARRQVLHITNTLWVVIDHTSGAAADRTETLWTTAHEVQVKEGMLSGSYDLTSKTSDSVLTKFIFTSHGASIKSFRGSDTPFAGWEVFDQSGKPASSFMIEQPANDAWSVVVWSLNDGRTGAGQMLASPSMRSWEGPENWAIDLPVKSGMIEVLRKSESVFLRDGNAHDSTRLILTRPAGIDQQVAVIQRAHEQASQKYPRFVDNFEYRAKATYLTIILLVLQEVFFALLSRKRIGRNYHVFMRGASTIAWVMLGLWLTVIRESLI